jgi:hypothetical protein
VSRYTRATRAPDDDRALALGHVDLARTVDPTGRLVLDGTVGIPRNAGRVDDFRIRVLYPRGDPLELPDVYDPVSRFPPCPQRHIEDDGRFCLWLRELAPYQAFSRPGGLTLFLARVQEFLELQMQYESRLALGLPNPWPGTDWDHGDTARRQWLRCQLDSIGHQRLSRLVAAAEKPLKRNAHCPCGSGRPVRACHQRMLTGMREAWTRDPNGRAVAHRFLESHRDPR